MSCIEPCGSRAPAKIHMEHVLCLWCRRQSGANESSPGSSTPKLRAAILPDMVAEKVDEPERRRRWQELADIYLAQQLANYPPDYFNEPTPERLLETVERFEEDLTDTVRVHGPIHAVIEVGEAIEVPPGRDRGSEGESIMTQARHQLQTMLEALRARRPQERPA